MFGQRYTFKHPEAEGTLTFKETSAGISITWIADKDASFYKVYMQRGNESSLKHTSIPFFVFENSVYDWSPGEKLRITVKSVGKDEKEIFLLQNVEYVVGGNTVVNTVHVKTNDLSPHNTIDLSWSEPRQKPEAYEVVVYKEQSKQEKTRFQCKETKATIPGLRTYSTYFCTVTAKYQDTSLEKYVTSDAVKTLQEPLPQSTGVKAYKHPDNPVRCIVVDWTDVHIDFTVTTFKVYLQFKKDGEPITTEAKNVAGANVTAFSDLKSQTKYTAYVEAIGQHKKFKTLSSNEVATDRALRRPGFDIKEAGKPKIQSCSAAVSHNQLKSNFTWKLAEIGEQKKNFRFTGVSASYKDGGPMRKNLTVQKDSCSAEPVDLQWGKSYVFRVACSYVDLDSGERFDAIDEQVLNTDIGKPLMQEVTWEGEQLTARWTFALGASKHVFKVVDEAKKTVLEETVVTSTRTFKMTNSCAYGRICIFAIESFGGTTRTSDSKEILIGGDRAVLDAVAIKCKENPRRQIIMKWKEPKLKPKFYKLQLYEFQQAKTGSEKLVASKSPAIEQTECSHIFTKLKSKTLYSCKVIPIYDDESAGGTMSNLVETETRIVQASESRADFGLPESITDTLKTIGSEVSVTLRWTRVELSENYELLHYNIEVFQKGYFGVMDSQIFEKIPKAEDNHVDVPNITLGSNYIVKFYTAYKDLDSLKDTKQRKEYALSTRPKETNITNCEWKDGFVHFNWTPVNGAVRYQLILKDEYFKDKLAPDYTSKVSKTDTGCSAKLKISESLRIGKICMAKVIAYTDSDLTAETDWNTFLIGGNQVPRNISAINNTDDIKRSVTITFDAPNEGPADYYEVRAIPKEGRKKCENFPTSPAIFEYLRKGVSYKFEVSAMKGNRKSEGSSSNWVTTVGGDGHDPMLNFQGKGGKYNFQGSNFAGSSTKFNLINGEDFGRVRDAGADIMDDGNQDRLSLHWNIPSFDNRAADYKVFRYHVTIRKKDGRKTKEFDIELKKNRNQYSTQEVTLELAGKYVIEITTVYEDIDEDAESPLLSSAYTLIVSTRPGKPQVITNNWKENELVVAWNAVKGAHRYDLEIFTEHFQQPFTYHMESKTRWTQKLVDKFGYGISYHATVTAYSMEGKTNSCRTERKTIGGDYIPRNVMASIKDVKITEPNTQVFLKWDASTEIPLSYEVEAIPNADGAKSAFYGTSCVVSGLKAGTLYQFKVAAIHKAGTGTEKSGGCLSNTVKTDPKPTQVKNVRCFPGENPSTYQRITWDKVNPEKQDESTKYRVTVVKCVMQESEGYKQEIIASTEEAIICGLDPGDSYEVTVAGGNSKGYGRASEKKKFTTAPAMLDGVTAELDVDGYDVIVQCKTAKKLRPGYFMRVICDGKAVSKPQKAEPQEGETLAKWKFKPSKYAKKYICEMWAENSVGEKGISTFSNPVISRPSKCALKMVTPCAESPSTDIEISWEAQDRCDAYDISIRATDELEPEVVLQTANISHLHRCRNPGNTYCVSVRAICGSARGQWCEDSEVTLAPAQVQLLEDGETASFQLNSLEVKWNPLKYAPEGYSVKLFCHNQQVDEFETTSTHHAFERLKPGSVYYCAISAFNGGITGQENVSRKFYIGIGKILNLEVQSSDSDGRLIRATWEALDNCEYYDVDIRGDAAENEANLKVFNTMCSYLCHCPGVIYRLRVRGCTKDVCSEWSDEVSVSLVPGPVDIKTATCVNRTIKVEWSKPNKMPEYYIMNLFSKSSRVFCLDIASDHTSHQFDDRLPGHQYYCTISGANAAGCGPTAKTDWIKIAWKKPNELSVRLDPDDPSHCAMLTWDHPDGVNCYKLVVDGMNFHRCFEVVEHQYKFENGKPGAKYDCRLHCGCDGQYDPDSVALVQPLIMAPEPPANIKVLPDKNPNRLEVCFDEPLIKPDKYRITVLDDANNVEYFVRHIPPHCYDFKELSLGKEYKLCIQSDNGEGLVSQKVSSVFYTYPQKVEGLHLSKCTNKRATVKWTRPTCIDEFFIRCKCGTKVLALQSTHQHEFEIIGLKRGKVYHVEVAAKNSTGQGQFSEILEFKTALSNLTHVTVMQSELDPTTSLIVEFKDPDKQSKDYIISAKAKSDLSIVTKNSQQMRIGIQGLRPGETYDVFVRAELGHKVSETAFAPEPTQTVPDKVTNVTTESNGDKNILRWPELRFPCSYRVRWKGSTEDRYAKDEAKTKRVFYKWPLDLKPGVKYEVQVRAENRAGSGEWSDPITFTAGGERSESGGQGGTMVDSKCDNFINHAGNVHQDRSTHTKMDKVQVSFSFPGITNVQPQVPSLEGATRPAQALMRHVVREILNSTESSMETPTTSGISTPPRCIMEESAVGEHGDADTVPKMLGRVLDQEKDDEQGCQQESIENEDEDSPDCVTEVESSVLEQLMECGDRDEPIQSGSENPITASFKGNEDKDSSDCVTEVELSVVEQVVECGDRDEPIQSVSENPIAASFKDNDDNGSQSRRLSESRSVGAFQSISRRLSRVLFCCVEATNDNELNDPLLENSS